MPSTSPEGRESAQPRPRARGKGAPRKESKALRRARKRGKRRLVWFALAAVAIVVGVAGASMLAPSGGGGLNTSLHQHVQLDIEIGAVPVAVPASLGIDPGLWNDHTYDEYGQMGGMSPLHTHDGSGLVHLELARWHPFTLGDLFDVWGQPFDRDRVLSYVGPVTLTVDGQPNDAFRDFVLQDGQQIVVRGG